jgi:hypothetical protein
MLYRRPNTGCEQMLTEKLCPKCQEIKKAEQFYQSAKRHDGLSGYCRTCQLRDVKARYSPHPRWRAPEGQKWCPGCKDTRPVEMFGKNKSNHDGLQTRCKPCSVASVTTSRHKDPTSHRASSKRWIAANPERHADNNAKRNYGIEHGTYAEMLEAQGGRCAICKTDKPGSRTTRFHIDHCHGTKAVRGLLCADCNLGLGKFKDNVEALTAAISYIEKARQ